MPCGNKNTDNNPLNRQSDKHMFEADVATTVQAVGYDIKVVGCPTAITNDNEVQLSPNACGNNNIDKNPLNRQSEKHVLEADVATTVQAIGYDVKVVGLSLIHI